MEEEKRKAYSEVVEILKLIEKEKLLEKIPFEVIELIKSNADPTYKPNISKEIPIEDQNLRKETYSIMGWIASKYWDEEPSIDNNISEIKEQNSTETEELGNIENVEETTENVIRNASVYNDIEPECLEGRNLPVLVSDMSWYERIKIKVIRWFKLLFRIKEENEKEGASE